MNQINICKDIHNRRLNRMQPLLSPSQLFTETPADDSAYKTVLNGRNNIQNILNNANNKFLIILGPCSIHDEKATLEYAKKLVGLQKKYHDVFFFVMRIYFEKPRTILGWRGLIVEPDLNGIINISSGLKRARKLLVEINKLGLPAATEFLDPIVPQYIADLISWASVGARSSESQIHRELASGLSMPVGFKNATDGDISVAINGIVSANKPHGFIGITQDGISAVMHTAGNTDAHLVLRGGNEKSNYERHEILKACKLLEYNKIKPAVIIDCSHDNSRKTPIKQPNVLFSVIQSKMDKSFKFANNIKGVMMESFLLDGNTTVGCCKSKDNFGRSITDPCMGWNQTEKTLETAYKLYKGGV